MSSSGTLTTAADLPTVPKFEWPIVQSTKTKPAVPPLELSTTGRHGANIDASVRRTAAVLINDGAYVGKAVHAQRKESS